MIAFSEECVGVLMGDSLQGVGGELAKGQTEADRYGWYKLVYSLVEQQLQNKRWMPSPAISAAA